MTLPLLPGTEPAVCRDCGHKVPTGRLYGGLGVECARQQGLLPRPQLRLPRRDGQDGPDLLNLLADVTPPHTSHVSHGQAECTERGRVGGMMTGSGEPADTGGDLAPPAEPTPRIAILARYAPRVCAGLDCSMPPHVRWIVLAGGNLFGRYWRNAEHIHLCDSHEREAVQLTGADWDDETAVPRQRRGETTGE